MLQGIFLSHPNSGYSKDGWTPCSDPVISAQPDMYGSHGRHLAVPFALIIRELLLLLRLITHNCVCRGYIATVPLETSLRSWLNRAFLSAEALAVCGSALLASSIYTSGLHRPTLRTRSTRSLFTSTTTATTAAEFLYIWRVDLGPS